MEEETFNSLSTTGWTTVHNRKTRKPKDSQACLSDSNQNEDEGQADCQDWKPVVLQKRSQPAPKLAPTRAQPGTYVTVSTGKVGQPNNYDPRRLAKIANETESFKIKRVDRATANQIQQARQAKKLTQKELALKMNVPLTVISTYENGTAVYDGSMIQRFKKYLQF